MVVHQVKVGTHEAAETHEEAETHDQAKTDAQNHARRVTTYKQVMTDTCLTFWHSTSLAGLSHAASSPFSLTKLFWLVLFITGTSITTVDIISLFITYFEYPYTTKIDLEHKSVLEFPAVTLCNQNRASCDRLISVLQHEISHESEDAEFLFKLYSLSNCGVDGLRCFRIRQRYINNLPLTPMERELCISCGTLLQEYVALCLDDPPIVHVSTLKLPSEWDILWKNLSCYENAGQLSKGAPESIATCPLKKKGMGAQMSQTPGLSGKKIPSQNSNGNEAEEETPTTTTTNTNGAEAEEEPPTNTVLQRKGDDRGESQTAIDGTIRINNNMKFLAFYMSLSNELKIKIGHDFQEIVKQCFFMGAQCNDISNFRQTISPTYGNCYTFKPHHQNTSLTGELYGLTIVSNIEQSTYLPALLTSTAGLRVAVHRPNTLALLDEEGLNLTPGMASSIAVKEVRLGRLRNPYSAACIDNWSQTPYQATDQAQNNSDLYTTTFCYRLCLQQLFMDQCNCSHPLYPDEFQYMDTIYSGFKPCTLTIKSADTNCTMEVLEIYATNAEEAHCGCNLACSEVQYNPSISVSRWPPSPSEPSVIVEYLHSSPASIEEDMLQLNVYFQSLIVETNIQHPDFDGIHGFVNQLGGTLSIYLGISLIMVAEILEFLFNLAFNSCLFLLGRYKPKEQELKSEIQHLKEQQEVMRKQLKKQQRELRVQLNEQHILLEQLRSRKESADLVYLQNVQGLSHMSKNVPSTPDVMEKERVHGAEQNPKVPPYQPQDPHYHPFSQDTTRKKLQSDAFDGPFNFQLL